MQTGIFQFFAPIRRRWWLIALIVVPICLVVAGMSFFSPTEYDGFVTITEAAINPDQQVKIFQANFNTIDPETKMNNLINTIYSYTVLTKTFSDLMTSGEWKPSTQGSVDDQFDEFTKRVNIEPVRGSELIKIHFQAESQPAAMAGIRRLYTNFRDHYIEINSGSGKREREFIEDQLSKAIAEFRKIAERRQSFIEKNRAVALAVATSNLVSLKAETSAQLNQANRDVAMFERQLQVYAGHKQLYGRNPVIVQGETTAINPVYDQLSRNLAEVTTNISSFGKTLGMKHPRMRELLQQQANIQSQMRDIENRKQVYKKTITATENNPHLNASRQNYDNAFAALASAKTRVTTLDGQIGDMELKLEEVPEKEKGLAILETEYQARQNDIQLLETRLTEAKIKEADAANIRITMIDTVFAPVLPKKILLKVALAFALSFALAVGLVLVLGQFDSGTYSPTQAENALGFPVIASLPRTRQAELPKTSDAPSPLSASYQIMSTNILETRNRMQGPGVVVAAAEPNVGRSSVAANLAVSLARDGARVVLVDADLREPSLHRQFGVENRVGLVDILNGTAAPEDAAIQTPVDGLLIITAGKPPANPIRLLRDQKLERTLEQIAKAADFVVLDSPAGATFADADVLAGAVQNVVLVHEAGSPATPSEMEFHKRLERLGANIIGVALNKVRPEDCHGYTAFKRSYEASILGREVASTTTATTERVRERPKPIKQAAPPPIASVDDDEDE